MNWLRNFVKKEIDNDVDLYILADNTSFAHDKLEALEKYLDIHYDMGAYTKRKIVKRPRKTK